MPAVLRARPLKTHARCEARVAHGRRQGKPPIRHAFCFPTPAERTGTSPVFAQRTRLKVLASTPGIAFGLSCTSARGCGVPNQC
jgi:hypothetical protein